MGTSTKLLNVLGIPTGTYTAGEFGGLTTNVTLGTASINGQELEVNLSTSLNDLAANISSADFSDLSAEYDNTNDLFRLQSQLSLASRISLGRSSDSSNILSALRLSETTQRTGVIGTRAKLTSFTAPMTSIIQNGDSFYLNNEKVVILDQDDDGITLSDIVTAINEVTTTTDVTAYTADPDSSSSSADGKLYLKRTNGTNIELNNGSLEVYSELQKNNMER